MRSRALSRDDDRVQRGANRRKPGARRAARASAAGPASISWMMRLPMTTASACAAIARALAASRMPKPTPTGMRTWRRISASLRATSAGIEMAGAGHALQRDVVDVAAREPRDGVDPRLRRRRREQEDRRDPRALPARRERRPLPPADSRRPARRRRPRRAPRRRSARAPSPRSGSRSPSARSASSRSRSRNRAHEREHVASARRRCASARSEARWITGPSAIGSENGTPSSITSAPARDERVDDRRRRARATDRRR